MVAFRIAEAGREVGRADRVGNRLGVTEAGGSSIAWSYDDAYRLTGETRLDAGGSPIATTTFSYDGVGNRLTMTVDGATTNYTFNELDQLLTAGAASYAYDARGNLTQATEGAELTPYSWDALDRLSDVLLPDSTALAYTYDADGRRMRQNVDGTETNYLWDENSLYGDVVVETDGTGAALASYVLGGPELLSQNRGGSTSYYLADAQGSTRALANAAGAVTDTYDYTAFGKLFASTGTTQNLYLYTGQQFDALTVMYSLRARFYDPALGRFLSRDPMEVQVFSPVEINRYAYGMGNPVRISDPSGQGGFEAVLQYATSEQGAYILSAALGTLFFITTMERLREFEPLRELEWVEPSVFGSDGTDPDKLPKPPGLWAVAWRLLVASIILLGEISGSTQSVVEGEPQPVRPSEDPRDWVPDPSQPNWVVRGGVSAPQTLSDTYGPVRSRPGHYSGRVPSPSAVGAGRAPLPGGMLQKETPHRWGWAVSVYGEIRTTGEARRAPCRTAETSPLIRARVAGCLYLLLVPFAPFAPLFVPRTLLWGLKRRVEYRMDQRRMFK